LHVKGFIRYSLPDIVRMIKSRTEHVVLVRDIRNFIGKLEEERSLGVIHERNILKCILKK
jgi:hypothetical protein